MIILIALAIYWQTTPTAKKLQYPARRLGGKGYQKGSHLGWAVRTLFKRRLQKVNRVKGNNGRLFVII
jgi:hypothetical protein